jgi:hypothetical protein
MKGFCSGLRTLPVPVRWASLAAIAAGLAGAVAGLVIGLVTYPPTAPFAAIELGLPAVFAGGIAGLAAGTLATMARRIWRHGARPL